MNLTAFTANEIGRGILIVFVFYVHSLYALVAVAATPAGATLAWWQLKVLAPQVAVFFLLAGMSSHGLGAKPLRGVLARSLMFWFLAIFSHVLGVVLESLLYPSVFPWPSAPRRLAGPILSGTGHSTYVAWFFIVLAATRILAWLFHRHAWIFLAAAAAIAAAGLLGEAAGLPANLFEWRNLPVSVALFLIGMRLPQARPIPSWAALAGGLLAVAIGLFVHPGLPVAGPCLRCDLTFVAQPMLGEYGFLPAYLAQVAGGSVALLWAAQRLRGTRLGRAARFFGRSSLLFLLLHGWVIVAAYPALAQILPRQESLVIYPAIMAVNLALHAALFVVSRPALAFAFETYSRAAFGVIRWLAPAAR